MTTTKPELAHRIYNTGKVMMGAAYEPPERVVDVGREAELIQSALLQPSTAPRIPRIRRSGPVVIPTHPGRLRALWAWLRGWLR
jgi:hypothetical protein